MWPGLGTDTLGEYAQVLIDRELYGDLQDCLLVYRPFLHLS